jgi:hypothetical protein
VAQERFSVSKGNRGKILNVFMKKNLKNINNFFQPSRETSAGILRTSSGTAGWREPSRGCGTPSVSGRGPKSSTPSLSTSPSTTTTRTPATPSSGAGRPSGGRRRSPGGRRNAGDSLRSSLRGGSSLGRRGLRKSGATTESLSRPQTRTTRPIQTVTTTDSSYIPTSDSLDYLDD